MARRALLAAALCGVAAFATAVPAEASHGCGAARSKGAQIVTKTREAVVFTKRDDLYGCLASVGSIRTLPNEGGGWDLTGADRPQLGGRYLAFSTLGSAIGDEFDRVYVYDLRLGRTFLVAGSNIVRALVVKRNGSVAWTEDSSVQPADADPPSYQLRRWGNEERQNVVLVDRGTDLDPQSLTLAPDRTSIAWTRGGTTRTAPLR